MTETKQHLSPEVHMAVRGALASYGVSRPIAMGAMSLSPDGTFTRRSADGTSFVERDGDLAAAARDLAALKNGVVYTYITSAIDRAVLGTPREPLERLLVAQRLVDEVRA